MPSALIDVSILGDKALERKLRRLAGPEQRRVIRAALKKSATRTKARVVSNLEPHYQSGNLQRAFEAKKIVGDRSRQIRLGIPFPTRKELGLPSAQEEPSFYPASLEYGHPGAPAYPYMRPAVDNHKTAEYTMIGRDVGRGIERIARKR